MTRRSVRSLRRAVSDVVRRPPGGRAAGDRETQVDADAVETVGAPRSPAADPRLERFWRRLARTVLDEELPEDAGFDRAVAQRILETTARGRAWSQFGRLVATGRGVDVAQAQTIRALCQANQRSTARALALGLAGDRGEEGARVGLAQVMFAAGAYRQAWQLLATEPVDRLARLVPVEALTCALATGSAESVATALELAAHEGDYDVATLLALSGRLLVTGHPEPARTVYERAARVDPAGLGAAELRTLENLRDWFHPDPVPPLAPGTISVGVIDYHSPDLDRSSKNIGDYVQTLAMLGNLARFGRARFSGPDGLGDLMEGLQRRVRPELRLDDGPGDDRAADVHLMPVSRDYSDGDPIPENTWLLAFGWHMHPLFLLGFGLPYHPNLNPVFLSFHLHRTSILTPAAVDYLRQYGPIGCRDWTTVDLLLSAGVDAFFTGCLTTTVNAVFPDRDQVEPAEQRVVAVIDLPRSVARRAKRPVHSISHMDSVYRHGGLVEGITAADELLAGYQRDYHRIVTRRLHSYLPATSLGVPVTFQPAVPGDARFAGLGGMQPGLPAFEDMRDGIRHLIERVFSRVLAGAGKDEVYAAWRELTADRVAQARARHLAPGPEPSAEVVAQVEELVARIRGSARRYGPHDAVDPDRVTDLAMPLDRGSRRFLPVALESVVAHASGPLRLWLTAREVDPTYHVWLAAAFPDLPITFLDVEGVTAGEISDSRQHSSASAMDRVLLPEVLPDVHRLVCLDVDTVTEGDVCELAATDLQGLPLAARSSSASASHTWRSAGDALDAEAAAELRRMMSARYAYDFATLNAGVVLLDLDRMRADGFTRAAAGLAAEFGLNDQELLNAYVGPQRAELDPRWNALPVQEEVTEPGIIHFAGVGKPWAEELAPYGERWRAYRARLEARVPAPAPTR